MKAIVLYESLTGNTRLAGEQISDYLNQLQIDSMANPITDINYEHLSKAEIVIVGSWTDGLVITAQKPGRVNRLKNMPRIDGKTSFSFCTYAINPGKTLSKIDSILEEKGGLTAGGVAINRKRISEDSLEFVERIKQVVSV